MVADFWVVLGEVGAWDPKFGRLFNDWEMEAVQAFLSVLDNKAIHHASMEGQYFGDFYSKSFLQYFGSIPSISAPIEILWNHYILSKVGFFAWEAWWGNVLTTTQLKRRGFQLASKCPFCGKKEEELEHILIHCRPIWG